MKTHHPDGFFDIGGVNNEQVSGEGADGLDCQSASVIASARSPPSSLRVPIGYEAIHARRLDKRGGVCLSKPPCGG